MSYGLTPDMVSSSLELFFTITIASGVGIFALIKLLL